ncbi:MAG: cellulase family glycosylhydrolase [Bacteroidetes bacterium]|nr:cellulase family glycosylhydrolase [Bacteroidota bacterium]
MSKSPFFILLFSLLLNTAFSQAVWNNSSFVHRNNRQILDGQNNPVQLEGVNLGGWLMWEGWIWGGGYTQEKTIYNKIESVVGTPAADAFRDSVHKNFITRRDIQLISEECFNVVRIPFNSSLLEEDFTPYTYKPEGWAVLDSVLKWCEDYNVYAILDMHSAPGGQSNSFTADPDLFINLWNGTVNQNRTRRMWKEIALRYKDRGIIAGYDLLNEPNVSADADLVAMYEGIIDSIRAVDQNHMLFIEGNNFALDFSMFSSLPDPNVAFQFHFYTWFFSSSIAAHLDDYRVLSANMNVPVWCGEWGENDYAELGTTLALLRDPYYGMSGSAFWTWKKMSSGNTYPYYMGTDTTSEWFNTIKWVSNSSLPQPTAAEMQTGINDFIMNMKADNCRFNDTLSDVLKACSFSGMDEPLADDGLSLYPNPASSKLTIDVSGMKTGKKQIRLYDAYGRMIFSVHCDEIKTEIDLSALPGGIYFISVQGVNESSVSKKIIKAASW